MGQVASTAIGAPLLEGRPHHARLHPAAEPWPRVLEKEARDDVLGLFVDGVEINGASAIDG
jgi:hypothetical protein